MKNITLSFFMLLSLTVCSDPAQIFIIRHAEKPPEGNELNLKGRERAAALVPFFSEDKDYLAFGTPVAIYAAKRDEKHPSYRPIQTVTPLADFLHLPVQDQFASEHADELVKEVFARSEYDGKTVLISWPHERIPLITEALGIKEAPDKWSSNVFDRVWVISYTLGQKPTFENRAQRLLFGDSPN